MTRHEQISRPSHPGSGQCLEERLKPVQEESLGKKYKRSVACKNLDFLPIVLRSHQKMASIEVLRSDEI